jgi:transglutaminase-like putative cysteine protease
MSRGERLALAALYAAAAWAFAVGRAALGAWLFLAPAVLAVFVGPRPVPAMLNRAVLATVRVWVGAVILFGAVNSLYPVLADRAIAAFALLAGYGLLALGATLLLGPWNPASGLLPVSIALIALASLDPAARLGPPFATAGLAGVGYLAAVGPTLGAAAARRRGRSARLVHALLFGAAAAALALGILRLLPWAQPRVEEATARLFNPAYAMPYAGFSDTSSLGDIEQLALSQTVALRVWTTAPRRLRARVLTQFTGRGWRVVPSSRRALVPIPSAAIAVPALAEWLSAIPGSSFVDPLTREPAPRVQTRIAPVILPPGVLFSAGAPWLVRIAAGEVRTGSSVIEAPPEAPGLYGVVHGMDDRVEAEASSGAPDAALLALPAGTDSRLLALARALGEGEPSTPARVARTVSYLGATCRYSLSPGAFRGSQPLAEFIFEKKRGYCEYFASAAAVLLRLQGVPTRYVTGFNVTDDNFIGGHYAVREADAHAWIDAYLPGRGWVEFDPTPAAEYAALREPRRRFGLAAVWDGLTARAAGMWIGLRFGTLGTRRVVPGAALLVVSVLAFRWWKKRGRAHASGTTPGEGANGVSPEVAALLARVDRMWARRGFPRPPHRAPLEHAESLPVERIGHGVAAAGRAAVECYYRARYGGVAVTPEELADLGRELP